MFLVHVDSLLGARREYSAASGVCREKVPDPRERSSRTACAEVPHARDASEQRRNPAQRAGAATALPRGSRISRDLGGSTGPHGSSGTGTRVCARAGRPRRRRFRCLAPPSADPQASWTSRRSNSESWRGGTSSPKAEQVFYVSANMPPAPRRLHPRNSLRGARHF